MNLLCRFSREAEIIRQLPHAGLLGFKIAQFFPVRVIPAVVCASGKPVCHRGHGEDRHKPRGRERDHASEQQIAENAFRKAQDRFEHIEDRDNAVLHLYRFGCPIRQIPDVLFLVILIEQGKVFPHDPIPHTAAVRIGSRFRKIGKNPCAEFRCK